MNFKDNTLKLYYAKVASENMIEAKDTDISTKDTMDAMRNLSTSANIRTIYTRLAADVKEETAKKFGASEKDLEKYASEYAEKVNKKYQEIVNARTYIFTQAESIKSAKNLSGNNAEEIFSNFKKSIKDNEEDIEDFIKDFNIIFNSNSDSDDTLFQKIVSDVLFKDSSGQERAASKRRGALRGLMSARMGIIFEYILATGTKTADELASKVDEYRKGKKQNQSISDFSFGKDANFFFTTSKQDFTVSQKVNGKNIELGVSLKTYTSNKKNNTYKVMDSTPLSKNFGGSKMDQALLPLYHNLMISSKIASTEKSARFKGIAEDSVRKMLAAQLADIAIGGTYGRALVKTAIFQNSSGYKVDTEFLYKIFEKYAQQNSKAPYATVSEYTLEMDDSTKLQDFKVSVHAPQINF